MSRSLSWKPGSFRARTFEITLRVRSESPPNSKKLSVMPTFSMPSTCCQISASAHSSGVRGAT
ncbi:hypothetical protein D3C80_1438840 [compost metagenome]